MVVFAISAALGITPNAIKLVLRRGLESKRAIVALPHSTDHRRYVEQPLSRVFAGRSEASASDLKRVAGWIADAINTRLKSAWCDGSGS